MNVRNHILAISTGIIIPIAVTYIRINRLVSKYSATVWHFTALSLGRTEYSFVSSLGYIDKGDRMANSYSINCRTWKWTKKLFYYLFDLSILNSYILFSSLGVRKFRIAIFRTSHGGNYWHTLDMNGMCKGQYEDHVLLPLKSLDLKNVAGSIGLFRPPREKDVVCVRKRVSPEMFQ